LLGADRAAAAPSARARLAATFEGPVYAIGDVHGCLDLLLALEARILADAATSGAAPTVIMLGDYIDRGPHSAAVIDHLIARPIGFDRHCLVGNHELAMLAYLDDPRRNRGWLEYGGLETLASYGIDTAQISRGGWRAIGQLLDSHVPAEHRLFLAALPIAIETPDWIFVHAGLRPGARLADQTDRDLCTFRDDFSANYAEFGKVIVHGHTPLRTPLIMPYRIAVDTGAYFSGHLSAVLLKPNNTPQTLTAVSTAHLPQFGAN
jgi:serine/threonine protein phosphatase 1